METNKYTLKDCGCYVDGARGIYAIDAIVEIAEAHGLRDQTCGIDHEHDETCDESRFAGCEFAGEIEDACDDYMNKHFSVDSTDENSNDGAYWGRNENGDWGLWQIDEN